MLFPIHIRFQEVVCLFLMLKYFKIFCIQVLSQDLSCTSINVMGYWLELPSAGNLHITFNQSKF